MKNITSLYTITMIVAITGLLMFPTMGINQATAKQTSVIYDLGIYS